MSLRKPWRQLPLGWRMGLSMGFFWAACMTPVYSFLFHGDLSLLAAAGIAAAGGAFFGGTMALFSTAMIAIVGTSWGRKLFEPSEVNQSATIDLPVSVEAACAVARQALSEMPGDLTEDRLQLSLVT